MLGGRVIEVPRDAIILERAFPGYNVPDCNVEVHDGESREIQYDDDLRITHIYLQDCDLVGALRRELLGLERLQFLLLQRCGIEGIFPAWLGRFGNLVELEQPYRIFSELLQEYEKFEDSILILDFFILARLCDASRNLGDNQLHGEISSSMKYLTGLISLKLPFNLLTWEIPDFFGKFENLHELDLDGNRLSRIRRPRLPDEDDDDDDAPGATLFCLPESFARLKLLRKLILASNTLDGYLPPVFGGMRFLTHLNLSNNRISGFLPESIKSLTAIKFFDICGNGFWGTLDGFFENMTHLEHLDVACNQFSGMVPPGWKELRKLRFLDIRLNGLSGKIPGFVRHIRGEVHMELNFFIVEGIDVSKFPDTSFCLPQKAFAYGRSRLLYVQNPSAPPPGGRQRPKLGCAESSDDETAEEEDVRRDLLQQRRLEKRLVEYYKRKGGASGAERSYGGKQRPQHGGKKTRSTKDIIVIDSESEASLSEIERPRYGGKTLPAIMAAQGGKTKPSHAESHVSDSDESRFGLEEEEGGCEHGKEHDDGATLSRRAGPSGIHPVPSISEPQDIAGESGDRPPSEISFRPLGNSLPRDDATGLSRDRPPSGFALDTAEKNPPLNIVSPSRTPSPPVSPFDYPSGGKAGFKDVLIQNLQQQLEDSQRTDYSEILSLESTVGKLTEDLRVSEKARVAAETKLGEALKRLNNSEAVRERDFERAKKYIEESEEDMRRNISDSETRCRDAVAEMAGDLHLARGRTLELANMVLEEQRKVREEKERREEEVSRIRREYEARLEEMTRRDSEAQVTPTDENLLSEPDVTAGEDIEMKAGIGVFEKSPSPSTGVEAAKKTTNELEKKAAADRYQAAINTRCLRNSISSLRQDVQRERLKVLGIIESAFDTVKGRERLLFMRNLLKPARRGGDMMTLDQSCWQLVENEIAKERELCVVVRRVLSFEFGDNLPRILKQRLEKVQVIEEERQETPAEEELEDGEIRPTSFPTLSTLLEQAYYAEDPPVMTSQFIFKKGVCTPLWATFLGSSLESDFGSSNPIAVRILRNPAHPWEQKALLQMEREFLETLPRVLVEEDDGEGRRLIKELEIGGEVALVLRCEQDDRFLRQAMAEAEEEGMMGWKLRMKVITDVAAIMDFLLAAGFSDLGLSLDSFVLDLRWNVKLVGFSDFHRRRVPPYSGPDDASTDSERRAAVAKDLLSFGAFILSLSPSQNPLDLPPSLLAITEACRKELDRLHHPTALTFQRVRNWLHDLGSVADFDTWDVKVGETEKPPPYISHQEDEGWNVCGTATASGGGTATVTISSRMESMVTATFEGTTGAATASMLGRRRGGDEFEEDDARAKRRRWSARSRSESVCGNLHQLPIG
ncbi:hypothetical protein BC829DRAFT_433232 [Chytridium lagenaria]|nr:hypothetical protein BC829DRAFT_433232 [Chytridium lagenaria]